MQGVGLSWGRCECVKLVYIMNMIKIYMETVRLTLRAPAKNAYENVVCLSRLLHIVC